jgi:hypothetical protein
MYIVLASQYCFNLSFNSMGLQHVLPFLGKWTRQSIPDLSGKVAVVSGFNSGIGFETTRALLEHNAEVGACRPLVHDSCSCHAMPCLTTCVAQGRNACGTQWWKVGFLT